MDGLVAVQRLLVVPRPAVAGGDHQLPLHLRTRGELFRLLNWELRKNGIDEPWYLALAKNDIWLTVEQAMTAY